MASLVSMTPPALRAQRRAQVRGLYVIVDPEQTNGHEPIDISRWALEGGARVIQLRDKRDKGYVLPLARAMAELCRERGALFIVNDHVDVAILAGADGVHLGQHDLPPAEARRLLPGGAIIGGSPALVGGALTARDEGADYIAVGAMFATNSKQRTRPAGLETLRRVRAAVSDRPLVAIGGINESNAASVRAAGADAIAGITAVTGAADVQEVARRLAALMQDA